MYRRVYQPAHHRADVTGMVSEHILIAEELLARSLRKGELVHHKSFNKLDNSPENLLFPLTRKQHQQLPEYQARFILSKGLYEEFLKWWVAERLHDDANAEIREVERKLTREENEQRRLQGRANKEWGYIKSKEIGNENRSKS